MATHPKAKGLTLACQQWLKALLQRGERIVIPEIADYEVRREQALLLTGAADVVVATTNVAHLSRFTTALDWQSIQ